VGAGPPGTADTTGGRARAPLRRSRRAPQAPRSEQPAESPATPAHTAAIWVKLEAGGGVIIATAAVASGSSSANL
jgi:hypothetical protein